MECRTSSPQETQALAQCLGELAQPGTVLVLDGPLGAGKTSFVQGVARGLGIDRIVNSPTFTLVKEY
ncbi:MAG: tRNA (adenosine(37)-N6)-threonylcarbamoyltransferase complex ATPase subunit type 1 TsaE, partial [Eubacteriales bacterium]|nr:tRNA (adenosine(37)-N6)-threonylcarbamoyltransferase complex ATPase subunit type 1 TsaE [Eubacteriales bacterium]